MRQGEHGGDSGESGSQASEREATTVTLNLERFHDCIDNRRVDAVQHARSLYEVEHVPSMAVLSAGSLTVRPGPSREQQSVVCIAAC